jgi:hypothetical protein
MAAVSVVWYGARLPPGSQSLRTGGGIWAGLRQSPTEVEADLLELLRGAGHECPQECASPLLRVQCANMRDAFTGASTTSPAQLSFR